MLVGYTALGFLVAHTSSVELQLLTTGVTYRHTPACSPRSCRRWTYPPAGAPPGHRSGLVRTRAPWPRGPFPPLAERFQRLEETLQIVHQMWSDGVGPFNGKHYQLADTVNSPQPLRRPPIMVGG
jgi:Luciferase-like monooxygenase